MFFSRALTFVNAQVVQPEGRMARTLRIHRGRIDGIDVAPDRRDAVIDLEGAFVFPGLINAHDHLELNSQPRLKWRDRYANAAEWIADFQPRFESDPELSVTRPETLDDRVWVGGLKNLLSGVTTVCHHNPFHYVLRHRFPIKVLARFGYSHSLHIDGERVAESHHGTPPDWPWMIHAAEGTDVAAQSEIADLDRMGCLTGNTVLIHGVAMCPHGRARVIDAGAGLVWCPSSNRFLFNATADVRSFDDADRLAIGSDSRLSGERDLLDELKVAYESHQLSAEGLARVVTSGAAKLLRLPRAGRIANGLPADVIVLRPVAGDPYDSLLEATRADVLLTLVDGVPMAGAAWLAPAFKAGGVATMEAVLDGQPRLVAKWIGRRVAAMQLQEPGFEVVH